MRRGARGAREAAELALPGPRSRDSEAFSCPWLSFTGHAHGPDGTGGRETPDALPCGRRSGVPCALHPGDGLLRGLAPLSGRRPRGSPARSSGTGRAARHGDAEAEAWTPERGASLNPPRTCPQPLGLHQPGLRDCAVAVRSMAKKRGPEGRRRASGGRGNGTAPASPDCGRQHLRQHLRQRPGLPHPTGTRATASPRQQ